MKQHRTERLADATTCLVLTGGSAAVGPYGVDKLSDLGYRVDEVEGATSPAHVKARDVVEHRLGFPVDKTLRSWRRATGSDIVLAFLEREAVLAAKLRTLGIGPYARRPLTMFACWLADDLARLPAQGRRALARQYVGVDLIMVWSVNQIQIMVDSGLSTEQVAAVPFGCEPEMFPVTSPAERTVPIVAVGFDRGRDYPTLISAVTGTDLELELFCKPGNVSGLALPDNVHFRGTVPFDEYRRIISAAQIVAVPTRDMAYPSGQTVALEASCTGACVAVSSTTALSEYFSSRTAIVLPPGDAGAWRSALVSASRDLGLRARLGTAVARDVRSRFTYDRMWRTVDGLWRDRGWVRHPVEVR